MKIVAAIAGFVALGALAASLFVWWRRRRFTRQRYAFWAAGAIAMLALTVITSIASAPPWLIAADLISRLFGMEYYPPQVTFETQLLLVFFAVVMSWMLYLFHRNWDGERTKLSFELERRNASWPMLAEAYAELYRRVHLRPPEPVHDEKLERPKLHIPDLEREELAFKDQVLEAIRIRLPGLQVNEYAWHPEGSCFVCPNEQLNELVVACCVGGEADAAAVDASLQYATRLASKHSGDARLILFTEHAVPTTSDITSGSDFRHYLLSEYIDNLVDFRDYFAAIRRRLETETLPNSDVTLRDTYTPLRVRVGWDESVTEANVNDYLRDWIDAEDEQHAALLADYGQGKSTCALYFCHQVITGQISTRRIPILVELRGRSPKSMNMLEFLSAWGAPYGINGRALLFLVRAKRVVLIFEGFDQLDEAGTFLQRSSHFSALWRFATRGSKPLFTGRPNFFLDETGLRELLMGTRAAASGPWLQICRLLPMNEQEAEASLRWSDLDTRSEILQLFESDSGFREMASRPSLLYQIAVVWRRSDLPLHGRPVTAAEVIGQFLRDSQRRQTLKASSERRFMLLNEAEELFFMRAVACHMAHLGRSNQVPSSEIEMLVRLVYDKLPADYRFPTSLPSHEITASPLRSRLADRASVIEDLTTEVRSHGLLVTDTSTQGTLKFAHKSYFEYLVAESFLDRLLMEKAVESEVIFGIAALRVRALVKNFLSVRFVFQLVGGRVTSSALRGLVRSISELTFRGLPGLVSEVTLMYIYSMSPRSMLRELASRIIESDDPAVYAGVIDRIGKHIGRGFDRMVMALAGVITVSWATVFLLDWAQASNSGEVSGLRRFLMALLDPIGSDASLLIILVVIFGAASTLFSWGLTAATAQRRLGMRSEIFVALALVALARSGSDVSPPLRPTAPHARGPAPGAAADSQPEMQRM